MTETNGEEAKRSARRVIIYFLCAMSMGMRFAGMLMPVAYNPDAIEFIEKTLPWVDNSLLVLIGFYFGDKGAVGGIRELTAFRKKR